MKAAFFLLFALAFSSISNGQEKKPDTTITKFTPPVIVKNSELLDSQSKKAKFPAPVIKKKPTATNKKRVARFAPPVIVKDSARKH